MTRQADTSSRVRTKSGGTLGRSEQPVDEDRPFAEIRRTFHDALRMLLLHRWAFSFPFCLVTCAAFVLSLYYPRTYSATTSFERRNDPVMMNLPMSSGAASFKYFRNTMVQDLTSTECMAEVVDNLGLIKDLERDEDGTLTEASVRRRNVLARSLAGTLRISTSSPSDQIDIVQITYTGPDPTIGRKLVDEVKRTYIRRTMAWIHQFLTSQRDYFKKEGKEALEQVKQAQREETRLRLDNPHVDPGNPGTLSLKLTQLKMEQRELLLREREYEGELTALQQLLAAARAPAALQSGPAPPNIGTSLAEGIIPSPEALKLSAKIREVDKQIAELHRSRGMTDQHPEIQEFLSRRQWLESELEQQCQKDHSVVIVNASIDGEALPGGAESLAHWAPYQAEQARLLVQIATQKAKLKDLQISLETSNLAIEQLNQAKREVFDKQEAFAEIMGKVAQARQKHAQLEKTLANIEPAIKAIEQDRLLQFSEGQPARGSSKPISPKAKTVVLMALLAGLATGVVFVVLAEILDRVFRSSSQVARSLGLPMLESIDEIVTAQDRRRLFVRRTVVTPIVVMSLTGLTVLTGSMAYLSIERPWTYEKIMNVPDTAKQLFAEGVANTETH